MKSGIIPLAAILCGAIVGAERLKPMEDPTGESFSQYRTATAQQWTDPEYPPELKATGEKATVQVRFIVDENGNVTEPEVVNGDERFHAAAIAAIAKWRYQPELRKGQPAKTSRDVRFTFDPAGPPKARNRVMLPYRENETPLKPPAELNTPDPDYPAFLESRRLSGEVALTMSINEAGRVDGVAIHKSTHPEFLTAALDTVARWELRPAANGRLPRRGEKHAVLSFSVTTLGRGLETGVDWLEHNGIFLREPVATKIQEYFDRTPEALVMVDPVYPRELLQAGTTGGARVNFTVGLRGEVMDVAVDEATAAEFGASLAAAIGAWRFQPLRRNGEPAGGQFSITWKFTPPRAGGPDERLLAALARADKFPKPSELDRALQPIFLRAPVHPAAYAGSPGVAGEADVEVVIDRDGRARLPRIVAATSPEFGWAAASAVSQWMFETPLRQGEATDLRVIVPVRFEAR